MQATQVGMVNPYAQWLFLITDQTDVSIFLPTVDDGQNISFMYNASETETNSSSSSGTQNNNTLTCYTSTLLQTYMQALHQVIRTEETRYFQTTEDDWSRSKPSAGDRANEVYRTIQVSLLHFSILNHLVTYFFPIYRILHKSNRISGKMRINAAVG